MDDEEVEDFGTVADIDFYGEQGIVYPGSRRPSTGYPPGRFDRDVIGRWTRQR